MPLNSTTLYIYTGKCHKDPGVKTGKFVVLIKGDEEMMTKEPCSKLNCGGDPKIGKCVCVENVVVAMCECKMPYYGKNCERSLDDYMKALNEEIDTNSEEFQKSMEEMGLLGSNQKKPTAVDKGQRKQ